MMDDQEFVLQVNSTKLQQEEMLYFQDFTVEISKHKPYKRPRQSINMVY